jgi:nucleoside diphosphate kinase
MDSRISADSLRFFAENGIAPFYDEDRERRISRANRVYFLETTLVNAAIAGNLEDCRNILAVVRAESADIRGEFSTHDAFHHALTTGHVIIADAIYMYHH